MIEKSIYDLISLRGKTSLITGAASGIGRAIAIRFAEAGSNLQLVDINHEGLRSVENECLRYNVKVKTYTMDVSIKKNIDNLWDEIGDDTPDILVNNVGIYPIADYLTVDEELLDRVMRINLYSTFWMSQYMIRRRGKKGGVIINIGTIEALLPTIPGLEHYIASKAGVIALTRSLVKSYSKYGFRINVIVPGGIITPGTMRIQDKIQEMGEEVLESAQQYMNRIPLGRLGEADEVARVALFLASELSSYITGAIIIVDGGYSSA